MKGPYERLKYDLRRLWECPLCHRRERTDGTATYRFCECQSTAAEARPTPMKLVEEAGHRTVPPVKRRCEAEAESPVAAAPADAPNDSLV